ncbi:Neuron-specific calcium-binding protein hippocalcin [Phytophthora cinnamomi]|uniref:Neuron-specific calcium-binding protein hippocalcin n=1 Tax=Phytophthora cinnamomi TaxID=4785 RepID=UPI00355A79B2|nr:Neuron-specific calcium-binding protein hippocalcin [Phytophthora cinnamomi]
MESLDRARALNALLALPRLERMLRVYRTWVNVEGVEGGMALTRRELQCVLEFPTQERHVDFLFDTFRCASRPRVDLLTLLTTATALAQGALADKARFVFALVDLDTEDDIVEAELALVISSCCGGLHRLGLVPDEDRVSEMDAMALAYEAFDFVGLEDGDKMTLAMFLKWCVFHPRPRALLERIGCLLAACDAVREMKEALQEHKERLEVGSLGRHSDVDLGSLDRGVEKSGAVVGPGAGQPVPLDGSREVRRVLGPVVGCVSSRAARVLIECDAKGDIACVAVDRISLKEHRAIQRVKAFRPTIFTLTELTPGRTYNLSLQGLLNEEFGVLQTPLENLPAFRLVIVSEDRFLDGVTEESVLSGISPPYLGNWKALEFWLDSANGEEREESEEIMQMWEQRLRVKNDAADFRNRISTGEMGVTSWGLYPNEQTRLLRLIFRKLGEHPRFHVVFVCSGAYGSRMKIKEISTQRSFEQIVVGPISQSASPSWVDQATTRIPAFADKSLSTRYSIEQEIPKGATKSQQYCALELVPHPLGASSDVKFYVQNHGEARLILGPIIGRVTPRTARILIELDRSVPHLVCTLTDPATSQSYSSRTNVEAFAPIILKVEGLQPGTRYAINFEGLLESKDTVLGHVLTPAWVSLAEKQWMQLEKALKKKVVMVFVLCLELPLILTDAKYVDAMREEAALSGVDVGQEEASGRWKLYDRHTVTQHWVSCRRQLEQLLNLLFRWKAKHRGRDVIVLSGGMRAGLETMVHDRETKLSVRNFTVGPLTARVEPDFSDMPLAGTACPTFLGGSMRDERFTFSHSIVASKNYLLTHAVIAREKNEPQSAAREAEEIRSASIETEFIVDDGQVDIAHPVNQYRRFPAWWVNYVPMGKIVFWDDTVMMRAQSDEDTTSLVRYLQDGREFTAALEVLFEKHQFAEAARMEELRSKHRRRQRGPEELRTSLREVFAELWKVLPDSHRQRVAYFRDEFVFDFLLGYLAPDLFEDNKAQDDDERPPLEFAAFSALCRDFIFNAGVLNLILNMQQEDERRTIALHRAEARRQAAEREAHRLQQEQQRAEEEAELERLQDEDPEEYAKRKLAEHELAQQEKLAKAEAAREQRKAEKLRDVEEELAIAKEQRKLDKLAESGNDPHEFTRRRELLAARVRKFEERKRLREADEARRREKKEKKKKEKAAPQKESH